METINTDARSGYPQFMSWKLQGDNEAIVQVVSDKGLEIGQELKHRGKINGKDYFHNAAIREIIEQREARGTHNPPKVFQQLIVEGSVNILS
ncbi:MAG TPA: hypothetical protein VGF79_01000 [Bacteroidia bacterium]